MPIKSANTTFEAGPIDKVVTGDPNAIASNKATNLLPVNSNNSLSLGSLNKLIGKTGIGGSGLLGGALNAFKSTSGILGDQSLVRQLQNKVDSGAFNPDEIKKRMKEMGTNVDKLGGQILAQTLKNSGWVDDATVKNLFSGGLESSIKNVKGVAKGFRIMADDIEMTLKDIDFNSVQGISKLVTSITGQSDILQVLGIEEKLAGLKLVNDIASAWGVPKLADKLFHTLDNDEDRRVYLEDLLPSALSSAHLENINFCISNLGATFIMAQYPGAINIILSNYHLSAEIHSPTTVEATALLDVLDQLDPHWASYNRTGEWIVDLAKFSTATTTALEALALTDQYKIPATYILNNSIRDMTWLEAVKMYYPYF